MNAQELAPDTRLSSNALMDISITEALLQAIGRGLAQVLVGDSPPQAEPQRRQRRAAGPRRAVRRGRGAGAKAARAPRGPRGGLKGGDYVYYRQGRGTFVARVAEVDSDNSTAVVRRLTDGKRVERPLSKLRRAPAP